MWVCADVLAPTTAWSEIRGQDEVLIGMWQIAVCSPGTLSPTTYNILVVATWDGRFLKSKDPLHTPEQSNQCPGL